MQIFPIILAAGQGTRMRSALPKVLHPIGGKAMLQHVIDTCALLNNDKIAVIYGHGGEKVQALTNNENLVWVHQAEQKGTGHAVAQAVNYIADNDVVIVAYGDVPLIQTETLDKLTQAIATADLCLLTTRLDNPTGYGRIVRDAKNKVLKNVEEKDATPEIRKIQEVNTGFIAAHGKKLKHWLQQLEPNNAQGEYYLTDCVELAVQDGSVVNAVICDDPMEVQGVNDRLQLATLERAYQKRIAQQLMIDGVTLLDPARVDVRGELTVAQDVTIDVNTVFIGEVNLGKNTVIESGCVIKNTYIGANVTVKANSVLEDAQIGNHCDIGPFARIRPGAMIKTGAKIGNFVEIKNSTIGLGSKVSHLSYIGDTQMGNNVNIGAGTITCNYDGANKFKTVIGDNAFIGSDTQLIAPVIIGKGATIGAGSTITKNTPQNELTLSRTKQTTWKGWKRPLKTKKE